MLQIISLFFSRNASWLIASLVVILIGTLGYFAYTGHLTINSLTSTLGIARDSLSKANIHVDRLQTDSTRLVNKFLMADNTRLEKEKQAEQAKLDAALAQQTLSQASEQNYRTVMTMTGIQKKQAADLGTLREKLGQLPTSTSDTAVNGIIATMAGKIALQDTTIGKLSYANGVLRAENATLTTKNKELADEKSDLENELNGIYSNVADKLDDLQANKPFLNIGLGKKIKRTANDIRAGRLRTKR